MRWLVEAADTKTGQETAITVEALTEAEAERLARYNGLLVSDVRKAHAKPAPVVPYAAPLTTAPPRVTLPPVARQARAARRMGTALVVIGWVTLVVAVVAFVDVALRRGSGAWEDWRAWLGAAADVAWRPAAAGLAALAEGTALRLLASIGLALRNPAAPAPAPPPAPREGAPAETQVFSQRSSELIDPARAGINECNIPG